MDLREGASIWEFRNNGASAWRPAPTLADVDAVIIGGGITGGFLAERLTRAGRSLAVLDKRAPHQGSTAASTALVMWETDAPLLQLEQRIGFEAAAAIWRRCASTIGDIAQLGPLIGAGFERRESLYLAGDMLDAALLKREADLRRRAGLGSVWIGAESLVDEGVEGKAALRSNGAGTLDPIQFTRALLRTAELRGAHIYDGVCVQEIAPSQAGVRIQTECGVRINASVLILATGYDMPEFVSRAGHRIDCTWAIAAPASFPPRALIWEASYAYAYLRGVDNYLIIGGEDEKGLNAEQRDARLPEKTKALAGKLRGLLPREQAAPAFAWSAFFGVTEDSLPLIGPVPGVPRTYAAYGYGGNGITFSALAADMLAHRLEGAPDPLERSFSLTRF